MENYNNNNNPILMKNKYVMQTMELAYLALFEPHFLDVLFGSIATRHSA